MEISPSVPTMAVTELDSLEEGFTLLDVRENDEWQAGHAPDALHIPLGELAARVNELPEGTLAVVCRAGGRSLKATSWLRQFGYDARNVDGGMQAWAAAGLQMVAEGGDGAAPAVI